MPQKAEDKPRDTAGRAMNALQESNDLGQDNDPTGKSRIELRWVAWLVIPVVLVMLLAWDFMPYLTVNNRGQELESKLIPGLPLARAKEIIRSNGYNVHMTEFGPEMTEIGLYRRGGYDRVKLDPDTTLLHVDLIPKKSTPWTLKVVLTIARHLPIRAGNAIRNGIDGMFMNLDQKTPTFQVYEVTSDTLRRRLK